MPGLGMSSSIRLRQSTPAGSRAPGTQTIGETQPFGTSSNISSITTVILEPAAAAGQLKAVRARFNQAGSVKIRACTVSGANFTFKGPTITLSAGSAGDKSFVAGADFTALPLAKGDYLGFYANLALDLNNGNQLIYYVSGDTIATGTAQAGNAFNADVQISFDVELADRTGSRVAFLGDSTFAEYPTSQGVIPVSGLIAGLDPTNIAIANQTISQQKNQWDARLDIPKGALESVIVQLGINDVAAGTSAAATITALQGLINEIKADVRSDCKIIISQMTPCAERFYVLLGNPAGGAAYQAWLDVNQAINGGGGTPITGVDSRVSAHVPGMNETKSITYGSTFSQNDCLKTAFDVFGDHVHPSNAGRQINADALKSALTGLGL